MKSLTDLFRTLIPGTSASPAQAPQSADSGPLPESVYFYTFHKCASTLFSSYVLKNIQGLKHVNYANQIYTGKCKGDLVFKERGFVYGPLRITSGPTPPPYQKLADITSDPEFVRDKIGIFFVRDPRDILVSSYFSFGYSHGLSPVDELRNLQQGARSEIQAVSLDEYVLASAKEIGRNFEILWDLKNACERSVLLKYEEMIENFDLFLSQFTKFVSVDPSVAREIHERSRPSQKEDASSHRRSGQVGGFRGKLKPETLDILAKELAPILSKFNY